WIRHARRSATEPRYYAPQVKTIAGTQHGAYGRLSAGSKFEPITLSFRLGKKPIVELEMIHVIGDVLISRRSIFNNDLVTSGGLFRQSDDLFPCALYPQDCITLESNVGCNFFGDTAEVFEQTIAFLAY